MQSRKELLRAVGFLPDKSKLLSDSYKEAWTGWLSQYADDRYDYGSHRRKNPNRDAKFIFNKLNNPGMIIWLAEASGVDDSILRKALAISKKDGLKETRSAEIRQILPWKLVADHLDNFIATRKNSVTTTHFVAYQNKDELGAYDRKGRFFTAKQFRNETLKGQHVWVFEGSGSPKRYDLVCHGTITSIAKEKRPAWYRTPNRQYGTRINFKVAANHTMDVTNFSWFKKLLLQQRSFFNGFSSIADAAIVRSLEKLASDPSGSIDQQATSASDIAKIRKDTEIRSKTTREALINARLGMGEFRIALQERWGNQCAVTGCAILDVLRASHIKPWSLSKNRERLDPANGILLAAHIDALFDRGLISFSDSGTMLLSDRIGTQDRMMFRLPRKLRLKPTKAEQQFLAYHRKTFGY